MPLFTPSTKTWVAAVQEIADTVGASADNEQTTRAHRSLRASLQWFNSGAGKNIRWDFLLAEAVPVQVVAPYAVSVTASAGQASASALTGHGLVVDDMLVGSGFMLGARITATGASGFGFSPALTGITGSQNFDVSAYRDFYSVPADFRTMYSVRMLQSNRWLPPAQRRKIDRVIMNESTFGTPEAYDRSQIAARGKIRLVPGPESSDVLMERYYRRMTQATASGDTTALDVLEDYEGILIAWAKWHFLTDKAEGRSGQAGTWLSLAQEGIKTMVSQQTSEPDETLAFSPGSAQLYAWGDSSTRDLDWSR